MRARSAAVVEVAAHERGDPPGGGQTPVTSNPPEYVRQVFAKKVNQGAWEGWQRVLNGRTGLSPTRKLVLSEIFAAEGGLDPDPNSSAVTGILNQTLSEAKARRPDDAELQQVRSPRELTLEQRATVIEDYLDNTLRKAGGLKTLDEIGDPLVAAAVADTLYQRGEAGGAYVVKSAANEVGGSPYRNPTGVLRAEDVDVLRRLVRTPEGRDGVLDAIAKTRRERENAARPERFAFRQHR